LPAARGVPKIEVTFDVDANGILSVTAKDTATGKDQKITITASSGLNEAEIQKMVKEAADHEADDKVRREQVERRNRLDNLCYTVERTIHENKDKLQAADMAALGALVKDGRDAVESQNDDQITSVSERLEKEAHRIASAMYQSADGNTSPDDAAPKPTKGGGDRGRKDIADADFEETQHGHP
jgi:molecular chaperone DnaK